MDWLAEPDPRCDNPWLVRYLRATHTVRADLRALWPSVPGIHCEDYLQWCYSELAAQDPVWMLVDSRRGPRKTADRTSKMALHQIRPPN